MYVYLIERKGVLGLSLSLALICCYFPMMFDTSLNFYAIYYKELSGNFFSIYTYIPSLFTGKIDYYFFIFMYTVIIYYCWLSLLSKVNINGEKISFLVILLLSLTYRDIMDLNRNALAISLALYGVFCVEMKGGKGIVLKLCIACLSVSIHMSVILIWGVKILSGVIRLKKSVSYIVLFTCLVIGYLLPNLSSQLHSVFTLLGGGLGGRMEYYMYGNEFGVEVYTFTSMIRKLMSVLIIFLIGILTIKNNNALQSNSLNVLNKIVFIICCVTLIFEMYVTFFERLQLIIMFAFAPIYYSVRNLKFLKIGILSSIAMRSAILYCYSYAGFFVGDYSVINNSTFVVNTELKPFIYPTAFLLDFDNTYSDKNILKYNEWGK